MAELAGSDAPQKYPTAPTEVLLGGEHIPRVGTFRLLFEGQRWEWSDAVARMHGYEPGTVTPTTDLLLSHKHPDDRRGVREILRRVLDDGEPFSSRHRIVDTKGRTHTVVVVGDQLLDDHGTLIGTHGFYIDLSESTQSDLDDAIAEMVEHREKIEQAKGMLMVVYGISAARAFDVLVWRSQLTNTKLRTLAAQLVADAATVDIGERTRHAFDHLLLTAHEGVPDS